MHDKTIKFDIKKKLQVKYNYILINWLELIEGCVTVVWTIKIISLDYDWWGWLWLRFKMSYSTNNGNGNSLVDSPEG